MIGPGKGPFFLDTKSDRPDPSVQKFVTFYPFTFLKKPLKYIRKITILIKQDFYKKLK